MKTDLISKIYRGVITDQWENKEIGQFVDPDKNLLYRFANCKYENGSLMRVTNDFKSLPIITGGILACIISRWGKPTKDIFQYYYNVRLRTYLKTQETNSDAHSRQLEKEFIPLHIQREKELYAESQEIYSYITTDEANLLRSHVEEYFKYIRNKDKRRSLMNEEQERSVHEIFDKAIKAGLMEKNGPYHYKWKYKKTLLAYFVISINDTFDIGKGMYRGKTKEEWKYYEIFFQIENLAVAKKDYERDGRRLKNVINSDLVDKLFS